MPLCLFETFSFPSMSYLHILGVFAKVSAFHFLSNKEDILESTSLVPFFDENRAAGSLLILPDY